MGTTSKITGTLATAISKVSGTVISGLANIMGQTISLFTNANSAAKSLTTGTAQAIYVTDSNSMGVEWDDDDDSVTWNANWEEDEGPKPEIDYQGWIFSIGIRSTFFSSFTFD